MRISLKDRSKTLHNLHEGLLELAGSETEMKICMGTHSLLINSSR